MSADTVSAQVQTLEGVAKTGRAFGLPIVHSTVNVKTGLNKPPIPHLRKVIGDLPTVDRTTINSWEDVKFLQAVKATGRKKLIMTALWTEACLTFPCARCNSNPGGVLPVRRFSNGEAAEWLDKSGVRWRAFSRYRRSEPWSGAHSRRTANGTMTWTHQNK